MASLLLLAVSRKAGISTGIEADTWDRIKTSPADSSSLEDEDGLVRGMNWRWLPVKA